ncbi:MAG: hypothetical protein MPW14_18595 [Candidatus Manganitrophus sp.]|nr:MAG: hypothetical protein MPW14_18595 [Candidatus Manganitrophus sp.]
MDEDEGGYHPGDAGGNSPRQTAAGIGLRKADHLAQIGKLRYQIFLFEQKAEKNFSEIGERIFELAEANGAKNPVSDPTIKKKLADAKKIERKLKSLHDKMAQLRERAA